MAQTKKTTTTTKTTAAPKKALPKITVTKVVQSSSPKKKKESRRPQKKSVSAINRAQKFFESAIMYPDIIGPFRAPRTAGSDRSILGADMAYAYFGIASTVSLFTLETAMESGSPLDRNVGHSFTAGTPSSGFTSLGPLVAGAAYPQASQVKECNLVSACLTANYLLEPLNVKGEVLVGQIPKDTNLATTSFNSLTYYPGVLRFPLAKLITEPIRVPMFKTSSAAMDYVLTNDQLEDVMIPFIAIAGFPGTGPVGLTVQRNWEIHPTASVAEVIPYTVVSDDYVSDQSAYQNATANLGELFSPVTSMLDTQHVLEGLTNVGMKVGQTLYDHAKKSAGQYLLDSIGAHFQLNRGRASRGMSLLGV